VTTVAEATRLTTVRPRRAFAALVLLDLRLVLRGAIVLVVVMAGLTAIVVLQYAVTFASPEDVRGLEVLAGNPAIRVLFGVPRALDQSGGFMVWRTGKTPTEPGSPWSGRFGFGRPCWPMCWSWRPF
jgi:ABC-2 type transport system permease protein